MGTQPGTNKYKDKWACSLGQIKKERDKLAHSLGWIDKGRDKWTHNLGQIIDKEINGRTAWVYKYIEINRRIDWGR